MRILLVNFAPWITELGIVRPHEDLRCELLERGHTVDYFDYVKAFGSSQRGKLPLFFHRGNGFPARAKLLLPEILNEYDVIDSVQGCLPFEKKGLGFKGFHVVRSPGLYLHYDDFEEANRRKEVAEGLVSPLKRMIRKLRSKPPIINSEDCRKSLEYADRIIVLNSDEITTLEKRLGIGEKCTLIHCSLREREMRHLADLGSLKKGSSCKKVVFFGTWSPRKGSYDWRRLLNQIWDSLPETKFGFYGTSMPDRIIWRDLGLNNEDPRIELRSSYRREELPLLLSENAIGAFPSYLEGFGITVLEQLAAGIPVVAYDAPGPREMLNEFSEGSGLLIPVGNYGMMAERILELLKDGEMYQTLSRLSIDVAKQFSAKKMVEQTIELYERGLELALKNG